MSTTHTQVMVVLRVLQPQRVLLLNLSPAWKTQKTHKKTQTHLPGQQQTQLSAEHLQQQV